MTGLASAPRVAWRSYPTSDSQSLTFGLPIPTSLHTTPFSLSQKPNSLDAPPPFPPPPPPPAPSANALICATPNGKPSHDRTNVLLVPLNARPGRAVATGARAGGGGASAVGEVAAEAGAERLEAAEARLARVGMEKVEASGRRRRGGLVGVARDGLAGPPSVESPFEPDPVPSDVLTSPNPPGGNTPDPASPSGGPAPAAAPAASRSVALPLPLPPIDMPRPASPDELEYCPNLTETSASLEGWAGGADGSGGGWDCEGGWAGWPGRGGGGASGVEVGAGTLREETRV